MKVCLLLSGPCSFQVSVDRSVSSSVYSFQCSFSIGVGIATKLNSP